MTKTTDQMIVEMLDREAIRDLPARYCRYIWTKDVDAMVGIFTQDALLSLENDNRLVEYRGADALRSFFGGIDDDLNLRPFIHNQVIELHGADRATGMCCLEVRTGSQMTWAGAGFYNDDYAKDGGTWKFSARRFRGVVRTHASAGGGEQMQGLCVR